MKIFSDKKKLAKFIYNEKNLGFVPTMGAIHKGHISLFNKSINQCNKTIVSIFINKPQFNRNSDFRRYPRVLKMDIANLKRRKIDYLYLPKVKQIYPNGPKKKIIINSFKKKLCGKDRPGHFEAIVDVIERFIKIINPNKIYLGEKDMQQLKIIEDFVNKKYPKVKIIGCKTVRETNGVAYSSRNLLLSTKERNIASTIYKILESKKNIIIKKKISLRKITSIVLAIGATKVDYIKVLNVNKIVKPFKNKKKIRIFIAYYLGSTRLIDNI